MHAEAGVRVYGRGGCEYIGRGHAQMLVRVCRGRGVQAEAGVMRVEAGVVCAEAGVVRAEARVGEER
jgi:hypothetical protein